ncbi:dihydropteroate synthase [Allosphingosinicella sp.]|uniref:dihydropteroate synthase n=1 Tax=Allosphingosinicella sp. TaxID=2823234 RepID=UPI003783542E
MTGKTYLRPTGFVDAPFGHDGKVARLAGGLQFFASVEIIREDGTELVPVEGIEARLDQAQKPVWQRLTSARTPLKLGERVVRLDQPQVVGIVNVTPDSFSDAGINEDAETAIAAGHDMASAGAAIVDVGGESTRPGAKPVWEGDESGRVLPVIKRLAMAGTAVSVDTRKALVMEQALASGAGMINDVSALTWDPRALEVVARAGCPVVLMHHQGPPETMQDDPRYDRPVILEVYDWLEERIVACEAAGIGRERIIVDPGFGFGKNVTHNLQLMNNLALLHGLGCAIMLGASRKRTIGALSGEAPADRRLPGSLAFALQAAGQGAQLLRVHDVPETVQALRVWRGLRDAALTPPQV